MNYSLWNLYANIKNGQKAKRSFVINPKTKLCESVLQILWSEGYILGYTLVNINNNILLKIFLKYSSENKPVIRSIVSISKPSKKIYYSNKTIWKIDSNKYFLIFSTNLGLKTILECKRLKIGGEPILIIN